jgi:hypothetical protein
VRPWRIVLAAVAVIVGVNVLASVIDAATGGTPGGPRSSSYATGGDGLAAYHDLLRDSGHPVTRLRDRPGEAALDPASTVVVLDPRDISRAETRALRRFVSSGGRLVAGGAAASAWLGEIVSPPPAWRESGPRVATVEGTAPEVAGVRRVETAGEGSWRAGGAARAVLGRPPVLAVATVGRGRAVLLADASPLQNGLLAHADNAALGLDLAGPAGRPVVFAETVHGYGAQRGLAALPDRWKWTLAGLLLAALAWIASRVRRLGPAERESRPLPPPRREYVDAVAAALARTGRPAASAERVKAAARARVARRAGLGAEPPADRMRGAALGLGLSEDEADALVRPLGDDDEDLLLAGRALAQTERGGR